MPGGAREERVARNETLFREVNERIKQVNVGLATIEATDFLCECGDESCTEPISLTMNEYEAVRAEPTHFAVVRGHVVPDIERVSAATSAMRSWRRPISMPSEWPSTKTRALK